ncbi:MAG TPA: TIGR01777 family oxidoreductase [Bryobacteraceae bacterium]|nr:TIGR01777 family oxidoreductase [Bryobacteraceae bacterium]
MTYLLTGATGFIGTRLAEVLLAKGSPVFYLGRKRSKQLDSRAAFQVWKEPAGTISPLDSVPRFDAVIHLAGEPIAQRWTSDVKRKIKESRTLATRNLVEGIARLRHRPRVLVSASAIGYYGNRGSELLTETSGPGVGFLAELCQEWEREAEQARELGLRVVRIRTGVVLAKEGGALAQMLRPFRLGVGGAFGEGTQWMSWIHRDDLVRMFQWAAENEAVMGTLNGTAPEPVTNRDFTKALAVALHRPAVIPVPKFALRVALGEMASFLFDSIRAVPAAAKRGGFSFLYPRLDDALRAALSSKRPAASL